MSLLLSQFTCLLSAVGLDRFYMDAGALRTSPL